MDLKRGMRDRLDKYININSTIDIQMSINGADTYDFCCFGVDADDKLSDERYMIFYNQTSSPNNEINYSGSGNSANFRINLALLPMNINKLVFTASIDGNTAMGDINSHMFALNQNGNNVLALQLSGKDFTKEKAIITVEIYRKEVWRINAVARGFFGGLSDLLRSYGGVEALPEVKQPVPSASPVTKISLKKGEKVSLVKTNDIIIIENGWTAKGKDYDLKALVRYRNGRLIYIGAANNDELIQTPEGAVKHGGDIKAPGELEHIEIKWHPDIASVAVSSYSALENGTGSFKRYGVFVRIKNGKQIIEISARSVSANERSYTLCFGEILFGNSQGEMEVSALEMYSRPNSERRIGYRNGEVVMDIGPLGKTK
ncbi:MAG: TerD family protein [Ruminococcus sp.]|nr:TerD family protein [Ruminococcus sp.]